jgi:ABC-type polysaccharide/polyol phosphate export permease
VTFCRRTRSSIDSNNALLSDLRETWCQFPIALFLARRSVRKKYRRTVLGIGWLSIERAFYLLTIIFITTAIFGGTLENRASYVVVGLLVYGYLTESALSGMKACVWNQSMRYSQIAIGTRILRQQLEVLIQFVLDLSIVLLVEVAFLETGIQNVSTTLISAAFLPIFSFELGLLLSPLYTRFRDVGPILESFIKVGFFVTPVVWHPDDLRGGAKDVVVAVDRANPISWGINLVRNPLLSGSFDFSTMLKITAVMTVLALPVLLVHNLAVKRIGYWI